MHLYKNRILDSERNEEFIGFTMMCGSFLFLFFYFLFLCTRCLLEEMLRSSPKKKKKLKYRKWVLVGTLSGLFFWFWFSELIRKMEKESQETKFQPRFDPLFIAY
jgi:hypothetical protein